MLSARIVVPRVFDGVAVAGADADLADGGEDDVLAATPGPSLPSRWIRMVFGFVWRSSSSPGHA